ncbi:MAG: hypothetical protein JKX67_10835 [Colwellia sp.]|nr:hypothetical protein [Colwellia sp.]
MKQNKKLTLAFMVVIASLLSACEDKDYQAKDCSTGTECGAESSFTEPAPEPEPAPTDYEEKSGVTGKVIGNEYWVNATVCFDNNNNAVCDVSEPQTLTYEDGKYSFEASDIAASISSKATLLVVKNTAQDAQNIVLYAPTPATSSQKGTNITVFTTLVQNETSYNPYTLANATAAQESLRIGSGEFSFGNNSLLAGQDYLENSVDDAMLSQVTAIIDSLTQAQLLAPTQRYKAVAAMVDSMYQLSSYTAEIEMADVAAQDIAASAAELTLSSPSVSWDLGYSEEVSADLHVQGDYAVVGSKWHNRLIVVNLAQDIPTTLSFNDFAASPDIARDDIDGYTGASEQNLANVRLTPASSVQSVLVAVEKYTKTGSQESADLGVGLYRANFADPSAIPFVRFAMITAGRDFYPFADLNAMTLSGDGNRVALSGGDKRMTILKSDDFSLVKEFSATSKYRAVLLNNDGTIVYTSLSAPDRMEVHDVATGDKLTTLSTGTEYPKKFKLFNNESSIAWYLGLSNILSVYDVTTPQVEPALLYELSAQANITSFDISPDGKLAVIGSSGSLIVYQITDNVPNMLTSYVIEEQVDSVSTPLKVSSVVFTDNNRALIATKNALQTLDVVLGAEPSKWSDAQKQAWFDEHRT